ncbi:MAG: SpoIID/LytB domain-containing protein [Actinomycetota bacterium]|nr:SpoIID/LytB domain-containing protein [Actinomycetota bacterium]
MLLRTLLLATLVVGGTAASARAESRLTIRGAGFGHGVGMSQYGALGFAQKGTGYREILRHYYTGTAIGSAGTGRTVRVLIASPRSAAFSNATRAGNRRVNPRATYFARARGAAVDLVSAKGRRLATVPAPLRVTSSGPVALRGKGSYRGALEIRPAGAGVNVINAVSLEHYVQGVVPVESPPSWPIEALKAQAVAARTYAITTSKGGAGFEQYADTRSQVYGGVGAEVASTNEAVRQTRGEVVTYEGRPVVTYFFSTSGGRTEDVENTSLGTRPLPWLKSVADPHDDVSPRHRWGPVRMSFKDAGRKLNGLVKGSLRGIDVISRGRSPRVVAADVVGSQGRVRVTGAQLRARLGLFDTWAYFTSVSTEAEEDEEPPAEDEPPADANANGGASAGAAKVRRTAVRYLRGAVVPARRGGEATVEIRTRTGWRAAGTARIRRGGAYRYGLCAKGVYRVRYGNATGAPVRVG